MAAFKWFLPIAGVAVAILAACSGSSGDDSNSGAPTVMPRPTAEAPARLVATQGYEPTEEELESFIPGDRIVVSTMKIEAVTASCSHGVSHLLIEIQEPLASGTEIVLTPSSPAYDPRAKRYSAVSDAFRATVDQPAAMFDIVLPASLGMIDYGVMFVTAWAAGQGTTVFTSNTMLVEPADFDCI